MSKMSTRKNWLLRLSMILNVAVIFYVSINKTSINDDGVVFIEKQQTSGRNVASNDYNENDRVHPYEHQAPTNQNPGNSIIQKHINDEFISEGIDLQPLHDAAETAVATSIINKMAIPFMDVPDATPQLKDIIECFDKDSKPRTAQRGKFWVLYNYVPARRKFRCHESITYTTHADFTFLDNLKPLLERWHGPVSAAMHAPGTDFAKTVDAIRYARDCLSPLVSEFVTFHVYFEMGVHMPKVVPPSDEVMWEYVNCSLPAPWKNVTSAMLYKNEHKMVYPVNVGRNLARETATTHFILPSDIELYPSPGLIDDFLAMVRRQEEPILRKSRKVYPISIFEINKGRRLPLNKNEMVSVVKNGQAFPFQEKMCSKCHNLPRLKEWLAANQTDGLHVFHVAKHVGTLNIWEPTYIGTNDEPLYEERLSWEGMRDKILQGYPLCTLDYEFHVLDNAFLIHKPGIDRSNYNKARWIKHEKTKAMINKVILPELKVLFGEREGCHF